MLSVVIPVHNEEQSLPTLHQELDEVARANRFDLEIVFVDDGSSDGSWRTIQRLAGDDARVRGIRFRRNFGKAAALSAAFKEVEGEFVFTLDGDLQDDPKEMPRLLETLQREGWDVISGYKRVRHDPWHKVLPSRIFNWMVSKLTGVKLHDHNCGYKCYRQEVVKEVRLYGELHRFVPVLAVARGFKVGEIVVEHRARRFGQSKYGVSRLVKGFLDLLSVKFITGYGQRPQHALGALGLLFVLLGTIGLGILGAAWTVSRLIPGVENDFHLNEHFPATMYSVASLLFGGQLLSIGFLGELVTSYHSRDHQAYSISDRAGEPHDESRRQPTSSAT